MHNRWLQASGNKRGDLYVAIVDYIRAFLQIVAYYQYLKSGVDVMGPSKGDLKLRCAQCWAQHIGDPSILQFALLGMLGANEFCTCDPQHEEAKIFGSQKWKLDISFGANKETHRPNTIHFSWPHLTKRVTKARPTTLPTIMEELKTFVEQLQSLPLVGTDICRVIVVQVATVNGKTWHIARIPKTFAKACWAQTAVTKKKCFA